MLEPDFLIQSYHEFSLVASTKMTSDFHDYVENTL